MSFHWPHLLWLLVLPLALLILELQRRRAAGGDASHPKILQAAVGRQALTFAPPTSGSAATTTNGPRVRWRCWLGLALTIVALARPQWGRIDEPVFDQAREIIIAVDLSRSMLTPDVRPSRLERAKLLVTSLLERLQGERVGLIVFAGTAFLQSPLSSDYEVLNEFLPALSPEYLPEGGTNYRSLIDTALGAFDEGSSADRFLIILSDGEATDDDWKSAAEKLKERGIRVIGLGVGTAQGAIIPDGHGGYVKDERGAVVLSKLEPATLEQLSALTKGVYRDASAWVDLAQVLQSTVEAGAKGKFREERQVRFVERFQWALGPALLFFLWSFWREFPVRPRAREIRLPGPAEPPPLPPIGTNAGAARSIAAGLALFLGFLTIPHANLKAAVSVVPPPSQPATPPEPTPEPPSSPADPLSKLVANFSERRTLTARDYAELAQATVTYGERMKTSHEAPVESSIRDGLAAVDAGEAQDKNAAEWNKLREQLKELLEKPEPTPTPPPQPQNKSQQNQSKQDQSKPNQSDQNQSQQNDNSHSQSNTAPSQPDKSNSGSSKPNPAQNSDKNSDTTPQNQAQPKPSAFGDMNKAEPTPDKSQNSATPETQKVGGTPEDKSSEQPQDPNLAVPLQRLEQVRNQDAPARLQQILRGEKKTPANQGKNW